ncbi:MAG: nucleotidyltransferase domain-containing protein [Candidatus Brocadia sp. AMX2]|uniref:nucleotidyltransferase domain-containing protein n=1 Tax=Candidatus Brocadia sinica TaxID=795830 RepID=UPI0009E2A34D|nr:nucleotidyltransferase domain-containing protein [Candidatus Brocadia sinica]KAA0241027.1 MAG: nucleotidyltransferase domain-containing protein [Candidatus Brocadia sp. AMX2]MBC6934182.1 nucleotidyltransferase domain-containing protein [Candidatus Brocadia sp.]MBL1170769.1 nucleotidyltransferase domain-containing protein [Candidatus Brocadia sp. AMX1]MCE7868721.1 nucleotidyltransferase domain-containing protein [Candidatus Brocadia sp. AMX2]MCQ3919304.1 nucleotidyltransferase domain-contain
MKHSIGKTKGVVSMVVVSDEVLEIIKRFIDMVSASGLHLERALLFGSHAKGTANTWSDIDVTLVSKDFTGIGFYNRKRVNPFIMKTMILPQRPQRINYGFFNGTDYSGGNRGSSYPGTRLIGIYLRRSPLS